MSSEAPRRSARNAGKPAPSAPAPAPAAAKRKSTTAPSTAAAAEKKSKPAPAKPAAAGQLSIGDKLPSLKLKLQDGKEIDTASLKNAVLFSYVPLLPLPPMLSPLSLTIPMRLMI